MLGRVGSGLLSGITSLKVVKALLASAKSQANNYYFANVGLKLLNKTGQLDTTSTYAGWQVNVKGCPWTIPAGTSLLVALPNFYIVEGDDTTQEVLLAQNVTVESVAVHYTDASAVAQRAVSTAFTNSGVLSSTVRNGGVIATITVPVAIPAGALLRIRIATAFTAGAVLAVGPSRLTANGDSSRAGTSSFATAVSTGADFSTVSNSASKQVSGGIFTPVFLAALGADGRPVWFIDGDSNSYGKGTPPSVTDRFVAGMVEPAMVRSTNGYEIPGFNASIAGSGIHSTAPNATAIGSSVGLTWNYIPTIRDGTRALVDQVTAMNSGKAPFTHYLAKGGPNSIISNYSGFRELVTSRHQWLKNWHSAPVIQMAMQQKATSNDGFRTLSGQIVNPIDSTTGIRFTFNDELIAGGIETSDYYVNVCPLIGYDTTTNRDKFKIDPFTATLTRAITAGATTIYLTNAPILGQALNMDPLSGTGQTLIVNNVVDVSGNGTEYQVDLSQGSSSGTYAAKPIGTLVGGHYTADGAPYSAGTHFTKPANEIIAPAFDAVKSAIKSDVSGAWV